MTSQAVRVAVALSGGVDSAVAALFLCRCVSTWRDVEALWRSPRPLPLDTVMDAIVKRRAWADITQSSATTPMQQNPTTAVHYFPLFMKNWDDVSEDSDGSASDTCENVGGNHRRRWCEAAEQDYHDAAEVARFAGLLSESEALPLFNFSSHYVTSCFDRMLNSYARGNTLNVDVLCNSEIKFGALLHALHTSGRAQYVATGHYARTISLADTVFCSAAASESGNGRYTRVIARPFTAGQDLNDQTLFLSRLSQLQLSNVIFPLGHVFQRKADVRVVASHLGLTRVSAKKTSTGLCFVGERYKRKAGKGGGFGAFLTEYMASAPEESGGKGVHADEETKYLDAETEQIIAADQLNIPGIVRRQDRTLLPAHYLTVGQRIRGAAGNSGSPRCYYVQRKEVSPIHGYEKCGENCCIRYLRNVWLVNRWNHPLLYNTLVKLSDVVLPLRMTQLLMLSLAFPPSRSPRHGEEGDEVCLRCSCCTRHQDPLHPAVLRFRACEVQEFAGGTSVNFAVVEFDTPVRAATAGQTLVGYCPINPVTLSVSSAVHSASWYVVASGWII